MNNTSSWYNFQQHYLELPELGFSLDTSLMNVPDVLPNSEEKLFQRAFQQMQDLEEGSIANPDENRMVGHYWLRNPEHSSVTCQVRSPVPEARGNAAENYTRKMCYSC
jgi:glucose-6-phosphate isomerase